MKSPHINKFLQLLKPKPSFSSFSTNPSSKFTPNHPILPLIQLARTHNHPNGLKPLHAHSVTSGLISDPFAASRIVQFFLQAPNSLNYALEIFHSLKNPDVYTWNLLISAHIDLNLPEATIELYFKLRASGAPPNNYTFALLVKSCIRGGIQPGRLAHGQVLKCGAEDLIVIKNSLLRMYCNLGVLEDARVLFRWSFSLDSVSWNTLISAYGKNGDMGSARELFDRMPKRNLVSWGALIDGYARKGDFAEALRVWNWFKTEGIEPDEVILASVLKACAHSGELDQGKSIHLYTSQCDYGKNGNVILKTAIIDMYCKCGCIDEAIKLFEAVGIGDIVLWNAMISGLAMHGDSRGALNLFKRMKREHPALVPTKSTYIALLCACTHAGMVDEGIEIFESMRNQGVEPHREHYGCIADLLGRAGRLREAEEVLMSMPMEAEAPQWGALMSACRVHKDVEVGERVGRRLIDKEPFDGGRYVMLGNLYGDVGKWEKAKEVRREMERKGLKKEIGHSLID